MWSNKPKHQQELKIIATALGRFQHSLAISNIRETTTTTHVKPKEEKPSSVFAKLDSQDDHFIESIKLYAPLEKSPSKDLLPWKDGPSQDVSQPPDLSHHPSSRADPKAQNNKKGALLCFHRLLLLQSRFSASQCFRCGWIMLLYLQEQ